MFQFFRAIEIPPVAYIIFNLQRPFNPFSTLTFVLPYHIAMKYTKKITN